MTDPYLTVRDVTKRFGGFTALDGVSLDIQPGEFVCFLGPSGCGKTTLLRAISGLDVQTAGEIRQGGRDISRLPIGQRDFGIVFQSYALFPNLSIRANVAYGLENRGKPRAQIDARVAEMLDLVGLADQARKHPSQLSGGQQQRVAIARALAPAPGLLLLDEPLSALDARVRARLRGEIRDLQRRLGITTIMVTHDQEEALTMSDRIVVMNRGRIEQIGTPTAIYDRPATPFVADFVGKMNAFAGHVSTAEEVDIGATRLRCAPTAIAAGQPVTVCIRPEEVAIRDLGGVGANVLEAEVAALDFVGTHFAARLAVPGTSFDLTVDLPVGEARAMDIVIGHRLRVGLPPDRLRVYARAA
ncbi:putative 2-aminoethylphosphonate ABC transporter ATP-binding protein [Inquilinus sp. CA228]|uniref:putative 2-aminoethylphosphonate ABC transporter ATP-binding protein n=1 Tax=Inquilinus sp. CA228 TaxID=3455609 RepID=UPI003F8D7014